MNLYSLGIPTSDYPRLYFMFEIGDGSNPETLTDVEDASFSVGRVNSSQGFLIK